jgi:DNA-binding SARP family transcriptional activator
VLGPFQVCRDGGWEQPPTRQVGRVGTVLAGWPGQLVERDRIVYAVWGDQPPATAANTVQVHMSHLRRMLGRDAVRSQGAHYVLDVEPAAIDAESFVSHVHQANGHRQKGDTAVAAILLTTALDLWRGTPFPDIADPDLRARRARLTEIRDQAREDVLECRLAGAATAIDLSQIVAEARELVSRHPGRDNGHRVLVQALTKAGRPREAEAARAEAAALGLAIPA